MPGIPETVLALLILLYSATTPMRILSRSMIVGVAANEVPNPRNEVVVPAASIHARGEHDGEGIDHRDQAAHAPAELELIEAMGEDLGVRAEAEVRGLLAAEEHVAPQAQVKEGLVPELVVEPGTGEPDGDPCRTLGFGPRLGDA